MYSRSDMDTSPQAGKEKLSIIPFNRWNWKKPWEGPRKRRSPSWTDRCQVANMTKFGSGPDSSGFLELLPAGLTWRRCSARGWRLFVGITRAAVPWFSPIFGQIGWWGQTRRERWESAALYMRVGVSDDMDRTRCVYRKLQRHVGAACHLTTLSADGGVLSAVKEAALCPTRPVCITAIERGGARHVGHRPRPGSHRF